MKKILISLIALVALTTAANAQYSNALGVRVGAGSAFGAELSYQGFLSDVNRLELDLGANFGSYTAVSVATILHWHWFLAGGFGFYIGPGVQGYVVEKHLGLGVGGQVGIDYQFNAPFQLSLDVRPMWDIFTVTGAALNYGAALGIRYAF